MIYDPSTLGTQTNQITFNNSAADPFYRIQSRIPQRREVREFDVDIPEQMGIADWESFIGKTYYIIQGVMYPSSETTYWAGREALQKLASMTVEQGDAGADFGYMPYTWTMPDGSPRTIDMKVIYVDIPESTHNGLKQPFRLFCKIKYPVILGTIRTAQIGGPTSTTTTGNSSLPFTLPRAIGLTTYSSTGTLYNQGHLAAYPTIQIYGPISNPKLTNTTTGEYIQVNTTLNSGSDVLVISYSDDEFTVTNDGNSVLGNVSASSTFFLIKAGNNNFNLTGDTVGAGAYATISAPDTYSLS